MKVLLAKETMKFNKMQPGFPVYIAGRTQGEFTAAFLENRPPTEMIRVEERPVYPQYKPDI